MVSRSTAELRLLGALAQAGAAGASREQLTRAAGIGYATFYRQIKGILGQGIVLEQEGRYRLDLSGPYGLHFKLWHDMELLYRLAPPVRSEILGHLRQARQDLGPHLLALWLVGSAAHGTHGPESDLDFLAVVDRPSARDYRLPALHPVHSVVLLRSSSARGGGLEPFPLIALRHGLLLFDGALPRSTCSATSPSSAGAPPSRPPGRSCRGIGNGSSSWCRRASWPRLGGPCAPRARPWPGSCCRPWASCRGTARRP